MRHDKSVNVIEIIKNLPLCVDCNVSALGETNWSW